MAYVSQEDKSVISSNLKPVLEKYGMKGTLRIRDHSTIVLTLKSGKIDFGSNGRIGRTDVNPYWFHEHYEGVAKEFLTEAFAALKSANWYDNSQPEYDYFDRAYYVDINIGKYDKPYQLV